MHGNTKSLANFNKTHRGLAHTHHTAHTLSNNINILVEHFLRFHLFLDETVWFHVTNSSNKSAISGFFCNPHRYHIRLLSRQQLAIQRLGSILPSIFLMSRMPGEDLVVVNSHKLLWKSYRNGHVTGFRLVTRELVTHTHTIVTSLGSWLQQLQ